jgi:serine/threonine-protein kinase
MSVGQIPRELGRYVLYDQIASGGMATVHFARLHGAIGFSRLVAIKRVHPNYVDDAQFVQMFIDEARLAARLDHPNVVSTLDVVADETEAFIVMEYVLGESLHALMPRDERPSTPLPIVSAIVCGVLEGLHSAHETRGDTGEPLHIVHRDVSPHNILVGVDGVARVFDFGIAKAANNTQETRRGVIKGKVAYMAPEQIRGAADRRTDLYAAGVILWELIAGRRRHAGERNDTLFLKLARNELEPALRLSTFCEVPPAVDDIVARATDPDPEQRFDTAREMAVALEAAISPAPAREVGEWIRAVAATRIERVTAIMRRIESDVHAGSDPRLTSFPPTSTAAIELAATTSQRSGSVSVNHATDMQPNASGPPPALALRNTMPAALVAFAAALILVGFQTIARHDPPSPPQSAPPAEWATATSAAAKGSEPVAPPPLAPSASAGAAAAPLDAGRARPPATGTAQAAASARPPHAVYVPAPAVRSPPRDPTPAPPPRAEPAREPAASAVHKAGCESPFAIGADGIRQIKPECI